MTRFLLFLELGDEIGPSTISPTLLVVIFVAIIVAIVTAIALNRAAHVKKEVRLDTSELGGKPATISSGAADSLREKIQKLPVRGADRDLTMQALTKIVEEESESRLKELKQGYSVKYQVMVQEKNKEVETVRREYNKTV